jgi:hypothetical protein
MDFGQSKDKDSSENDSSLSCALDVEDLDKEGVEHAPLKVRHTPQKTVHMRDSLRKSSVKSSPQGMQSRSVSP